ncbi:unnamed protein product [Prorocentrum cordatum]|uniref:Thioredoxin domain-containing protein n=1 Tax=Prorocentrum cordatum TaxID=2364126 RepID=A0ABN9WE56_9DINO|nr:unnamed protein product [Polarella glacialis]
MLASTAVRWLPQDFVEASQAGGIFTLSAYALMFLVVVSEVGSFVEPLHSSAYHTLLTMSAYDEGALRINFDVQLYDIECRHLKVSVLARGTEENLAQRREYVLRPVHTDGKVVRFGGGARTQRYSDDGDDDAGEVQHRKGMEKVIAEDGEAELDSDWSSSHDGFRHQSFEHVVQAHDFTFINFFAGWCSHCQKFAPTWASLANTVNEKEFKDAGDHTRKVRMIKLNCVDFREQCQHLGIDAYPTLRLYNAEGNFSLYEGGRNERELLLWVEKAVKRAKRTRGSRTTRSSRGDASSGALSTSLASRGTWSSRWAGATRTSTQDDQCFASGEALRLLRCGRRQALCEGVEKLSQGCRRVYQPDRLEGFCDHGLPPGLDPRYASGAHGERRRESSLSD